MSKYADVILRFLSSPKTSEPVKQVDYIRYKYVRYSQFTFSLRLLKTTLKHASEYICSFAVCKYVACFVVLLPEYVPRYVRYMSSYLG